MAVSWLRGHHRPRRLLGGGILPDRTGPPASGHPQPGRGAGIADGHRRSDWPRPVSRSASLTLPDGEAAKTLRRRPRHLRGAQSDGTEPSRHRWWRWGVGRSPISAASWRRPTCEGSRPIYCADDPARSRGCRHRRQDRDQRGREEPGRGLRRPEPDRHRSRCSRQRSRTTCARQGMAEVLKAGLVGDPALVALLERDGLDRRPRGGRPPGRGRQDAGRGGLPGDRRSERSSTMGTPSAMRSR